MLDQHLQNRMNGRGPDNIRAYSTPKSQQIALRENGKGGLPVFDGMRSNVPKYSYGESLSLGGMSTLAGQSSGGYDMDVGQMLAQRAQQSAQQQPAPQGNTGVCQLQEGYVCFQPLNIPGAGTTMPLVRKTGQLQGVQGKSFQLEGAVQCYVVDGLQTVDLSRIDPQRMVTLVKVSAPFSGTYMVPMEAVVPTAGASGAQRQILTDSSPRRAPNSWMNNTPQQQPPPPPPVRQSPLSVPQQNPRYQQQQQVLLNQREPQNTNIQQTVQQQGLDVLRRRGLLRG